VTLGLMVVGVLCLLSSPAFACEACFGNPDAPETHGIRNAVLFMLSMIGLVQVGFVKLFWEFRQRGKRSANEETKNKVLEGGLR
jgi:hypothetical protein